MGEATPIDAELTRVLERGREVLATGEEIARWEAQQGRRDRAGRIETSGIGDRLDADATRAIVEDTLRSNVRALELVRAWLASPRAMLVLLSVEPGLGKTTAAAWALSRVHGRYVRAQELCELRAAWRERERYDSMVRGELLVIDELGTERDATEARETLQDVVDLRQRMPRRTLLLGNLEPAEFESRYDKRTLDRLGVAGDDSGIAVVRSLKGTSLRRAPSPPAEGRNR